MTLLRPGAALGVRLAATGAYLPERVVSNADLVALGAPLDPAEIERLTGIRERRWAAPEEAASDLAVHAARVALARAGAGPPVDRILVATVSPDHPSPATACRVQHLLGLAPAAACDVVASCAGFLYALDAAARAVLTGDRRVLVVASEIRSRFLDLRDRATAPLFGDGAAAAVVEPGPPGEGIEAILLGADGAGFDAVKVAAGGSRRPASAETVAERAHTIRMHDGPTVFLTAVEGMLEVGERLLAACGLAYADVDLLIPHQPNRLILERLARYARLPLDRVVVNVDRIGNASAASIALALDEALTDGRARPGARLLLCAAGAGYTAGAALVRVSSTPG